MDDDLFAEIVQDIKSLGRLRKLGLYGDGEPFLQRGLVRLVELAMKSDVADMQVITTNASVMTPEIADRLVRSGWSDLRVSVYSVQQGSFQRLTGSRMDIDRIYGNVELIRSTRDRLGAKTPFLYVKMIDTYGPENDEFKARFAAVADEVNIETPMNWNGYQEVDLISRIDPGRRTDETAIQGYYAQRGRPNVKEVCTYPFHSLCVKCNGDVTICIVDWNKGTKVGNLREETLGEIWNGPALREFRRMHIERRRHENPSCRNCNFLHTTPENIDEIAPQRLLSLIRGRLPQPRRGAVVPAV